LSVLEANTSATAFYVAVGGVPDPAPETGDLFGIPVPVRIVRFSNLAALAAV
jgi:hypothetical protein